jgi:hypothetical protein
MSEDTSPRRTTALKPRFAAIIVAAILVGLGAYGCAHREQAQRGGTPPAYYYDAANDRYWDPEHGHWHDGPPPPESERAK